jgi:hypothetical protein
MLSRIAIVLGLLSATSCKSDGKKSPAPETGSGSPVATPDPPTTALPVTLPAIAAEKAREIPATVDGFVVVMKGGGLHVGKGGAPYRGKPPRSSSTVRDDLDSALGRARPPETASAPASKTPVPDPKDPTAVASTETKEANPKDPKDPKDPNEKPRFVPSGQADLQSRGGGGSVAGIDKQALEEARRRGILKKRKPPTEVASSETAADQEKAEVYTPVEPPPPPAGPARVTGIVVDAGDRVDVVVLADAEARAAAAIDVLGQLSDRHAALAVAGAPLGRLALRFAGPSPGPASVTIAISAAGVAIGTGQPIAWTDAARAITTAISADKSRSPPVVAIQVADDTSVQQLVDALAAAIAAGAIVDVGRDP